MAKMKRRKTRSVLLSRLRRRLGVDPAQLPVLEQTFDFYERPNLHLALEELMRAPTAPLLDSTRSV